MPLARHPATSAFIGVSRQAARGVTLPNGIPLSKIHHAAFDAHLIGIEPDYKVPLSACERKTMAPCLRRASAST